MTNKRRPLPHEFDGLTDAEGNPVNTASINPKYQDQTHPLSGTASNAAKAPHKLHIGHQNDVIQDWEAIAAKLAAEGFRLNLDATLDFISYPDLPKEIEPVNGQLLLRDKSNATTTDRHNLIGVLANDSESAQTLTEFQRKVAKSLWHPLTSDKDIKALGQFVKEWQPAEEEFSDRNWRGVGGQTPRGYIPRKLIPARNQFPAAVRGLEFGDIFTIFKGASLEQVQLFLGRVILGHQGTTDPQTKVKLRHTYRNILVVDGAFAGQGKTTIFNFLSDALSRVGFAVDKACPSLSGRFNHHKAFTSDLILADDITTEHLGKELNSPNAKILATNGTVSTEQKGVDAIATRCSAAMMILANRVEARAFWGLDDGMRSRVTLCSTEPEGSLPAEMLPFTRIPALANQLGVDRDTIMLWACRLAADEFAQYINENSSKLEVRVKELADMSNSTSSDPLDGTLAGLALGYMLENGGKVPSKRLSKDTMLSGLKGFLTIKQTPELAQELGDTRKIAAWSPASGCYWVNPQSLLTCHNVLTSGGVATDPNELTRKAFKALSLRDGNQCYSDPGAILPRWTNLISNEFSLSRIQGLYDKMANSYAQRTLRSMPADIKPELDIFFEA